MALIRYVLSVLCLFLAAKNVVGVNQQNHQNANVKPTTTAATTSTTKPTTVAVIGCGPSGMFFLHALAEQQKELEKKGDLEGLSDLPSVTVFERASSPGGVWRSDRKDDHNDSDDSNDSTNMYEGLWINGYKEGLEFFDYTFDDHFGEPQSVFLPRQKVFEYMMARVSLHGDIFQNVQFDTTVQKVAYDDAIQQFVVTTTTTTENKTKNKTGLTTVEYFDKCIWAAGANGKPNMVPEIMNNLQNYQGQIVHSSGMNKLVTPESNAVKGETNIILMIGDSSSAEDLILQTIKLGVDAIYVSSRRNHGTVSETSAWPMNKVVEVRHSIVAGIRSEDGSGKTVFFLPSRDGGGDIVVPSDAQDIDIIILCTGYLPNDDFLLPWANWENNNNDDNNDSDEEEQFWSMEDMGINASEWNMKPNYATSIIGNVQPAPLLGVVTPYNGDTQLYKRRILMSNPNMMFLFETCVYPLLEIDVGARDLLAYIIGTKPVPTLEEMQHTGRLELLEAMQENHIRYIIDSNYASAVDDTMAWGDTDESVELLKANIIEMIDYQVRYFAQMTKESAYPLQIGNSTALNAAGEHLRDMMINECMVRLYMNNVDANEREWRTVRDLDPSSFRSLHTGTPSIALAGKWIELDDQGLMPGTNNASAATYALPAVALTPTCADRGIIGASLVLLDH